MKIIRPIVMTDTGTFTRSSTAMFWGSNGFLQTSSANTPRFSYNPANLNAGPTLLNEAASTNLALQSQAFSTSPWVATNLTITNPATPVALDNTTTTNLLTETTANGVHNTSQPVTISTALPYVFTVYVKAGARSAFRMQIDNAGTNGCYVDFNLTSGTASAPTQYGTSIVAGTASLVSVGNSGWYRAALSIQSSTLTSVNLQLYTLQSVGVVSYLGDGASGFYAWGAQFEQASVGTTYMSTTTATFTRTAETNTAMLTTNIPENDYPEWNSTTTYAQNAFVIVTLTGGAPHYIYQSLIASNLNNPPATSSSAWVRVGADNRWKLFDGVVTNQTTQTNGFAVGINPAARFDSVTGLNCNASTATINVVDPVFGNIYQRTVVLTSYSGIQDWYAYFYEPIVQQSDFTVTDIPATYSQATITVSFTGANASAGELVVGLSKEIGYSEWGAKASIIDYSVKTKDSFGNYVITPRNFSKRLDINVQVPIAQADFLEQLLAGYRTTPIVYVGSNAATVQAGQPTPTFFTSAIVYGYYKDFQIDITYNDFATCSLQVEGLT
jgi:hypothetical protein